MLILFHTHTHAYTLFLSFSFVFLMHFYLQNHKKQLQKKNQKLAYMLKTETNFALNTPKKKPKRREKQIKLSFSHLCDYQRESENSEFSCCVWLKRNLGYRSSSMCNVIIDEFRVFDRVYRELLTGSKRQVYNASCRPLCLASQLWNHISSIIFVDSFLLVSKRGSIDYLKIDQNEFEREHLIDIHFFDSLFIFDYRSKSVQSIIYCQPFYTFDNFQWGYL